MRVTVTPLQRNHYFFFRCSDVCSEINTFSREFRMSAAKSIFIFILMLSRQRSWALIYINSRRHYELSQKWWFSMGGLNNSENWWRMYRGWARSLSPLCSEITTFFLDVQMSAAKITTFSSEFRMSAAKSTLMYLFSCYLVRGAELWYILIRRWRLITGSAKSEDFRWEVWTILKIGDECIEVGEGHCHPAAAKSLLFF